MCYQMLFTLQLAGYYQRYLVFFVLSITMSLSTQFVCTHLKTIMYFLPMSFPLCYLNAHNLSLIWSQKTDNILVLQ